MSRSVVVAAGGANWEGDVLDEIRRADTLQLHRRCLDVADVLAVAPHCDVAVLSTELPGLDADATLAIERDGVRVIGLGDPDRGTRLGIVTMAQPGQIESILREAPPVDPASSVSSGSIVAVWGPHGAPGRSVVAASLASALAADGRAVTLVDADARGGALAQMFALLDDVSGLVAACRSANRGDLDDVSDHLVDIDTNLRLLSGVPRADMWAQVREGPFELVLRHVAQNSEAVVVDTGPGFDHQVAHVLGVADRVVLVGRADPVGLARLVRAVHDLQSVDPRIVDEAVVVINLMRSSAVWSESDVADAVTRLAGVTPDAFLPADFPALDTAALRGRVPAEVAPNSPFSVAMAGVVARVACDRR